MSHYHAVVWIDHQKATVWQFTSTEQTSIVVHAHDPHHRVHSRKSADHPTDAEVLAYARRHFKAIDRMFAPA